MIPRSLDDLASTLGGRWIAPPAPSTAPGASVSGASIDTRTLEPGDAFFAFRGERVDGRTFIPEAFGRGASVCVVDAPPGGETPPGTLLGDDRRRARTDLALDERTRRRRLRLIGVTGTNGKTTTTRLIEGVLGASLRGRCSPKSFNNALGLPLTILSARADDDFLVCEMGTSSPGEIGRLSAIARPDIAVITSIGRGHLERLGSLAGVAREKAAILGGLAPGGIAFIHDDAPELDAAIGPDHPAELVRVGSSPRADRRVRSIEAGPEGVRFGLEGMGELLAPLPGAHNARNGAIAALVGERLGLDRVSGRAGLGAARGAVMRLSVERLGGPGGGVTLINDAYNANPDSVRAALATLATFEPAPGARRVAILGDMLELGGASRAEHAALLEGAPASIDLVVALGEAMSEAAGGRPRTEALGEASDEACVRGASMVRAGDVVLLKGSRSVRLERVARALRERASGGMEAVHSASRTDDP
ncbi:MAG: UDP-N-acetylmuramoyl-tripeptide--D-alanyl-D-alanine ligase [Phycisphaerales bacterium JB059]